MFIMGCNSTKDNVISISNENENKQTNKTNKHSVNHEFSNEVIRSNKSIVSNESNNKSNKSIDSNKSNKSIKSPNVFSRRVNRISQSSMDFRKYL